MSLWDKLWKKFRDTAPKYKTPVLTPEQVQPKSDATPIAEGTAYCRLWLVEMRLARGVDWFNERYPVVYTATTYEYGGSNVTVPYIAGVDSFKGITQNNLDKVVTGSVALTPLFPYKRNPVELKAGLFSMRSDSVVSSFIQTMGRFTKLLPVPELSTVLKVADELYSGIESLFDAGDSRMELGYQQTFSPGGGGGSNDLRQGYFAVILTPEESFANDRLRVIDDALHLAPDKPGEKPQPVTGYNYLLFRLEKRPAQDWEALTAIKELVHRAQDALQEGKVAEAKQILGAIRIAILRSPDVVKADQKPMFEKIEAELRELGLEGRRVAATRRSLYQIMQRPAPAATTEATAEWASLEQIVAPEKTPAKP
jgi:hypothetical protein